MARVFTRGTLGKPEPAPGGGVRVQARVTRPGVFAYRKADGTRERRYRSPAVVAQALGTRVHYGRRTKAYDASVTVPGTGATRHVVTGLQAGTWYVALTTVDPAGLESDYSEERVALVN